MGLHSPGSEVETSELSSSHRAAVILAVEAFYSTRCVPKPCSRSLPAFPVCTWDLRDTGLCRNRPAAPTRTGPTAGLLGPQFFGWGKVEAGPSRVLGACPPTLSAYQAVIDISPIHAQESKLAHSGIWHRHEKMSRDISFAKSV